MYRICTCTCTNSVHDTVHVTVHVWHLLSLHLPVQLLYHLILLVLTNDNFLNAVFLFCFLHVILKPVFFNKPLQYYLFSTMATTDSDFEGSLGGLSYYKRNGKTVVRQKGGPNAEQIKKSKSCQPIRDSNREFGSASHVCALIRRAIGKCCKDYSDMNLIGTLTGILKKMMQAGTGKRGAQVLDIAAHRERLDGFEFNADCLFESRFKTTLAIDISEDRNTATLQTSFRPATDIAAPADATSFQLLYTFMRLPSYGVHVTTGRYGPLHDAVLVCAQVASDFFYTSFNMRVKLLLPLTLPESVASGTTLLCIVGIAFYKDSKRMGKEVCAMRVVKVG